MLFCHVLCTHLGKYSPIKLYESLELLLTGNLIVFMCMVPLKRLKTLMRKKPYEWLLRKLLGKIIEKILQKNYRKLGTKKFTEKIEIGAMAGPLIINIY